MSVFTISPRFDMREFAPVDPIEPALEPCSSAPIPAQGASNFHNREPHAQPMTAAQQAALGVVAAHLALANRFSAALFGPRGERR